MPVGQISDFCQARLRKYSASLAGQISATSSPRPFPAGGAVARRHDAQAKLTTGEYAPLIAADAARLESILRAASGLAKANNVKMRVIKFTNRLDIEEIAP